MKPVTVVAYNTQWPQQFNAIQARLASALEGLEFRIEHVGSTSVPQLAAKDIIDIDIIVPDTAALETAITLLATLGYEHQGELGIPQRHAFFYRAAQDARKPELERAHNLYVVIDGCAALRNHLQLRNYLRRHPDARAAYDALKRKLAQQYQHDRDGYTTAKTAFITGILAQAGMEAEEIDSIARANE